MRPENARKQRYGGRTFRPVTRWRKVRHHRLAARADKNVPTFSATGRERRFGTQARERHAFRCSGQQGSRRPVALPASLSGRRPPPPFRQDEKDTPKRIEQQDAFSESSAGRSGGFPQGSGQTRLFRALHAPSWHKSRPCRKPPAFRSRTTWSAMRVSRRSDESHSPTDCRIRAPAGSGVTRPFPVLPSVSGRLNKKKESWKTMTLQTWSGRLDLNQRLPAPKAGALPLRHAPNKKGCPAEDTGQPYFSKN